MAQSTAYKGDRHPLGNIPEGTPVLVRNDDGEIVSTRTRSIAWPLGHGEWVVKLEGFGAGGYLLDRVQIDLDALAAQIRESDPVARQEHAELGAHDVRQMVDR
jgi:hypothetical protein